MTVARASIVALFAWVGVVRAQTWPPYLPPEIGPRDPWDGADKAWHALASLVLCATLTLIAQDFLRIRDRRRWLVPVALTAIAGAAKEGVDWLTHRDVSARDFAADVVGALLGVVVVSIATALVPIRLPSRDERPHGPRA